MKNSLLCFIMAALCSVGCSQDIKKNLGLVKETPDEFIVRPVAESLRYPESCDELPDPSQRGASAKDVREQLEADLYYERLKKEKEEEDWRMQLQKKIKKVVGTKS